jgi:O-antigen/teichoic acid export membrane protein
MSLVVNALIIPLTVRYLGKESYGLWVVITSTVIMYLILDIGIANTLTNLISEAYASGDETLATAYATTALWLILAIAAAFGAATWAAWPWIRWAQIFDVRDPALAGVTSHTVAVALFLFLAALPCNLATRILAGYQELHIANGFAAGGNVLSLLSVAGVVFFHGSLPSLVGAYAGSPVAANLACLLWIWMFHKPWMKPWPTRIVPRHIGRIFHSGSQFFVIQMASLVVSNSDNVVISHYLGPAEVTPYSIAWRLTGYLIGVQAIAFPAIWPAYSEAYTKGDLQWVQRTYRRVRRITLAYAIVGGIGIFFFGRQIIGLWAGRQAEPSMFLIRLMCIWMVICVIATNQACLMGALGRVRRQAISSSVAAMVNLALSIWWVQVMGTVGVLLGTIVSYLIFVVTTQSWEVHLILREQSSVQSNTDPHAVGRAARG